MLNHGDAQPSSKDNFLAFIQNIQNQVLLSSERKYAVPTSEDLRSWTKAFYYFRMHALDSCNRILSQQNYSLVQIADHQSGHVYDVFRENLPVKKGWGTFVYNRRHAKRLFINVTHPADDGFVARIGSELFQKTRAEWLYVAGTKKTDKINNVSLDAARTKESLLQRWHEIFTDLTHITLSLHGFDKKYYDAPVSNTDVVLSNGKTSDEQWGISQISLSYRDSLKSSGFSCAVAMYDSGFASLGWGVSPQGMFSNDSVGFGHWMNIELSKEIRHNAAAYSRFIAATDRAMEITGKKISQQVNRAFGLVSPRTLRLDAKHGLLFPPNSGDTYRIVSFNSGTANQDTIRVRVGSWLQFPGSSQHASSMTRLDSSNEGIVQQYRRANTTGVRSAFASIVEQQSPEAASFYPVHDRDAEDSSLSKDDNVTGEPMQVHRIPLHRRSVSTSIASRNASMLTPYEWQGDMLSPVITYLQFGHDQSPFEDDTEIPNFLIPIINRSFNHQENSLAGVRMSHLLVQQIARLVSEHREESRDVQLLAEMADNGDYYLRVFPRTSPK